MPPIPCGQKALIKWRTILETSDAVIQNLQESRSKANFCNKKREKAKRLHRLKIQTEGHTQSGLVHLTVVITWCSRDCSASTLKAASYDPASMTLPAQTSSSHRFPSALWRLMAGLCLCFGSSSLTSPSYSYCWFDLWGQRFLSHETHCGCWIRAPFLSCSWNMLPFMIWNHRCAMKFKWARTSGYLA